MSEKQSDIVERLRDPMLYFGYRDRVIAADEIERLRKVALAFDAHIDRAVRAEREAILKLIESKRADYANVYFGDYCLRTVAAAIRTRGDAG
jgi:hypothetical protein